MAKRKRLQGQGTNQPVGFADIGGIGRTGRMIAASMQPGIDAADAIFEFASKKLDIKRAKQATLEASTVEFEKQSPDSRDANNPNSPNFAGDDVTANESLNDVQINIRSGLIELPELRSELTISGRAYNEKLLSRYEAQLNNNIADTITEIAIKNPDDPNTFQKEAGSYINETIKQVDPRIRPQVEEYTNKLYSRLTSAVLQEKAKIDLAGRKIDQGIHIKRLTDEAINSSALNDYETYKGNRTALAIKLDDYKDFFPTNAHKRQYLRKVDLQAGGQNLLDSLSQMKTDLQRQEAVEEFLKTGKGALANKFIKSLDLKQPEYEALATALRDNVTAMRKIENAQGAQAVTDMLTKAVTIYEKDNEINFRERFNVTEEAIRANPRAVLAVLDRDRAANNRKSADALLKQNLSDLLDSPHTEVRQEVLKLGQIADKKGFNLQDKFRYIKNGLDDFSNQLEESNKQRIKEQPVVDALLKNAWGGGTTNLPQTRDNIEAATRIFTRALEEAGLSTSNNTFNDDRTVERLIPFVSAHGVIPETFTTFARTAIGNPENRDAYIQAAMIIDRIQKQAPQANIMGKLGSQFGDGGNAIIEHYTDFINRGGLIEGGANEVGIFDTSRLTNDEKLVKTRELLEVPDSYSKAEANAYIDLEILNDIQSIVGPSFFERNMPGPIEDGLNIIRFFSDEKTLTQREILAQKEPVRVSRELIKEVKFAFQEKLNVYTNQTAKQLMQRSIKEVISSGKYARSIIATPAGSNYNQETLGYSITKNAPEARMHDINGDIDWISPALTKHVKKVGKKFGYKDDKELELGRNAYLDFIIDDSGGTPIYEVIVNTMNGAMPLVDEGGNTYQLKTRPLIVDHNAKLAELGFVNKTKNDENLRKLREIHDMDIAPEVQLLELPAQLGRYIEGNEFGINPAVSNLFKSLVD